ncbi:MAG: TRAP transporter small permease [Lentisphaeria bacterium]|jgi:TRAP-type C4-dicarboxylate transport system permease small subunit
MMWKMYHRGVSALVMGLAGISALSVVLMMLITCVDVIMRRFGQPLPGAVDIVSLAGCVSVVTALPYTTAVKGHVAVEYFFQKLPRLGRVLADSFCRTLVALLFCFMSWRCVVYGTALLRRGSVTLTLQIPIFWVWWLMAFSFAVVVLVKIYNLMHPGQEMMKP